ncbi:hypothetical protein PINS_up021854 [Pythium insidiosum]|nr:hypothetical protein PINS_up021854 [Pythium insidiosum]
MRKMRMRRMSHRSCRILITYLRSCHFLRGSGQISDVDVQSTWEYRCDCKSHEVRGADERLQELLGSVEKEFELFIEAEENWHDPLAPYLVFSSADENHPDECNQSNFLRTCMKSIKPFFLEDFINVGSSIGLSMLGQLANQ